MRLSSGTATVVSIDFAILFPNLSNSGLPALNPNALESEVHRKRRGKEKQMHDSETYAELCLWSIDVYKRACMQEQSSGECRATKIRLPMYNAQILLNEGT